MLVELYSDKFISNGDIRPPITFQPGLNTVCGSDSGSNSIGKSTFLMIIDFVFGGKDYVDNTKVKGLSDAVGVHTIKFTFEFNGVKYFFTRSTDEPNVVNYCAEKYENPNPKSLEEYKSFLKEKYSIKLPDLSFRDVTSGYFRIFHRGNDSVDKPLKSFENDTPSMGIDRLIKLFNLYAPIAKLKKDATDADEKKKAYKKLQKYNVLPQKMTKTQLAATEQRLENLRNQLLVLTEGHGQNLMDSLGLNPSLTDKGYELSSKLSSLQYQRRRLREKMRELECNMGISQDSSPRDFGELGSFFGGIDMKRLDEIESFHIQLRGILDRQFEEAHSELEQLIKLAEQDIVAVGNEIQQADLPKRASKAFWGKFKDLEIEIQHIEGEIKRQQEAELLIAEAKSTKAALDEKEREQAETIQNSTTEKINELNDYVYDGAKQAPNFEILSSSKYEFYTPNDGGTGTAYRGLILFDISVLSLTELPALAHDSFLFKNIEDEALEKIMELYAREVGKQVFIAIDKTSSYTKRTQELIRESTRLKLSRGGNELFGSSWNERTD